MLLEFDKMDEVVLPHFRGGEKEVRARMVADGDNRIMHGILAPGASIGMHLHDHSSEAIYILSGTGRALCGEAVEALRPGVCHYCPKGQAHSLVNDSDGDLVYFAVVPQHE